MPGSDCQGRINLGAWASRPQKKSAPQNFFGTTTAFAEHRPPLNEILLGLLIPPAPALIALPGTFSDVITWKFIWNQFKSIDIEVSKKWPQKYRRYRFRYLDMKVSSISISILQKYRR